MKATHTLGRWTWDEMDGRIYITPDDRPCHYIADINSRETDPEADAGAYPTAATRRANARAIALVPDLLDFVAMVAAGNTEVDVLEMRAADLLMQARGNVRREKTPHG